VWKSCVDGIVEMIIPNGTATNEDRTGIVDSNYAKFRAEKAYIVSITNPFTKEKHSSTMSKFVYGGSVFEPIVYTVGQYVTPDKFDTTTDDVCSSGIHYFRSYDAAFSYHNQEVNMYSKHCVPDIVKYKYTGDIIEYSDNGFKMYQNKYENGERVNYMRYRSDGSMNFEYRYKNGKLVTETTYYNTNIPKIVTKFEDNIPIHIISYDSDGEKTKEIKFKDEMKTQTEYNSDGSVVIITYDIKGETVITKTYISDGTVSTVNCNPVVYTTDIHSYTEGTIPYSNVQPVYNTPYGYSNAYPEHYIPQLAYMQPYYTPQMYYTLW
jgi:hypothetical protein